jgi:hypothetical protein
MTAASLLLLCSCASSAQTKFAPEPDWPVVWEKDLALPFIRSTAHRVSDFDKLLLAEWGEPLTVIIDDQGKSARNIHSCAELLEVTSSGKIWDTAPHSDYHYMHAWRVTCDAMRKMGKMRPYKEGGFSFDLRSLLPNLSKVRIPTKNLQFNLFFESLKDITKLRCNSQANCTLSTEEEAFRIHVLALGDFNGDGVQDLMLRANSSPRDGFGHLAIGVILTRTKPNGELKVLTWW